MEIVRLYREGMSAAKISEGYEFTRQTVYDVLKRQGAERRTQREAAGAPNKEREKEIVRLYLQRGWTQKMVSESTGFCRRTVSSVLKKAGIQKENRFSDEECSEILKLWEQGETKRNLMKAFSAAHRTIMVALERARRRQEDEKLQLDKEVVPACQSVV
jgi:DNA invertase Pin-like site-specific DNA recombinase